MTNMRYAFVHHIHIFPCTVVLILKFNFPWNVKPLDDTNFHQEFVWYICTPKKSESAKLESAPFEEWNVYLLTATGLTFSSGELPTHCFEIRTANVDFFVGEDSNVPQVGWWRLILLRDFHSKWVCPVEGEDSVNLNLIKMPKRHLF